MAKNLCDSGLFQKSDGRCKITMAPCPDSARLMDMKTRTNISRNVNRPKHTDNEPIPGRAREAARDALGWANVFDRLAAAHAAHGQNRCAKSARNAADKARKIAGGTE